MQIYSDLQQVPKRFPEGIIPLLDPIKDMQIKDKDFVEMYQRSRIFEDRLLAHKLHKDTKVESLCKLYHEKQGVRIMAAQYFILLSVKNGRNSHISHSNSWLEMNNHSNV